MISKARRRHAGWVIDEAANALGVTREQFAVYASMRVASEMLIAACQAPVAVRSGAAAWYLADDGAWRIGAISDGTLSVVPRERVIGLPNTISPDGEGFAVAIVGRGDGFVVSAGDLAWGMGRIPLGRPTPLEYLAWATNPGRSPEEKFDVPSLSSDRSPTPGIRPPGVRRPTSAKQLAHMASIRLKRVRLRLARQGLEGDALEAALAAIRARRKDLPPAGDGGEGPQDLTGEPGGAVCPRLLVPGPRAPAAPPEPPGAGSAIPAATPGPDGAP